MMRRMRTLPLVALLVIGCGGGGAQTPAETPSSSSGSENSAPDMPEPEGAETGEAAGEGGEEQAACCKAMNECKGKGGCAVEGKHDCQGKNECKGQGGCNKHCPAAEG